MADNHFVVAWLNDAYAMEQSIIHVLENHSGDAKDHPEIQSQVDRHLEQTRRHAELVKGCIERLGGSTSALKSGMAHVMGIVQGASTGAAKDEMVKNCLADYATEHFEIASYRALIAAAQQVGDQQTVIVCEEIIKDEQEMAHWLTEHLPMVVQQTLQQHTTSGA